MPHVCNASCLGGSSGGCDSVENSDEGVTLSYSTDQGSNWLLLQDLAYDSYGSYRSVKVNLPAVAKTHSTRFRWMQPKYSTSGADTWALGNVSDVNYCMYVTFIHQVWLLPCILLFSIGVALRVVVFVRLKFKVLILRINLKFSLTWSSVVSVVM